MTKSTSHGTATSLGECHYSTVTLVEITTNPNWIKYWRTKLDDSGDNSGPSGCDGGRGGCGRDALVCHMTRAKSTPRLKSLVRLAPSSNCIMEVIGGAVHDFTPQQSCIFIWKLAVVRLSIKHLELGMWRFMTQPRQHIHPTHSWVVRQRPSQAAWWPQTWIMTIVHQFKLLVSLKIYFKENLAHHKWFQAASCASSWHIGEGNPTLCIITAAITRRWSQASRPK